MGTALVIISVVFLYYIYDGYGRLLLLIEMVRKPNKKKVEFSSDDLPSVTIILPVYNEEAALAEKLDDLLLQQYPRERIEILVVSDGSTDNTNAIAANYADRGVNLLHTAGRVGKSAAQNVAVEQASGEILILTDVAVRMAPDCMLELVAPFADERVGCVTAQLYFDDTRETPGRQSLVSKDQSRYWNYELRLRRIESCLGWLAVAAGPAMAVRRDCWRMLESRYGDDCIVPLDVILQGKTVQQAEEAIAWDVYFDTFAQEFRARVRMTVRNWGGTFSRRALLNPIRFPQYAFALWSHKILRWLSPIFLITLSVGCLLIWISSGVIWPLVCVLVLVAMSIAGILAQLAGKRFAGLSTLGSFSVVNAGFAIGLLRVLRNRTIEIYSNRS